MTKYLGIRTVTFAGGLLAAVIPLYAGATDLVTILQQAIRTDPQYREAQANAQAIAEEIPQAQAALYLPEIRLNGSIGRVRQDITLEDAFGQDGVGYYTGKQYRATLSQPVIHLDRYVALKQANKQVQQAQYELDAARQDLVVRTAERYFDVLAAQDNLEFATAEKQSLQGQLEQAKQRFEVGLIAITDVQEAQAGFDRALASEIVAENELDNTREALRETTAIYYDDLSKLGSSIRLAPPDPADIDEWTGTAIAQNLDVAAANVAADIALDEIKFQKAGHYPTLDINGTHSYNDQGGRFGASETHQSDITLELNVPFYLGGRIESATRQATYEYSAALQRLEQAKRAVFRETRQAYLGVIAQISTVKALRQAVLSSETAVDSTNAGFEVGTRTGVDVVDAERELFEARRDLSRARYDYIVDILRLKQAAGTLVVEDLLIANSWLVE